MQRSKLVVLVAMLSLSACGGESDPDVPEAAKSRSPEASASHTQSPSQSASPTPTPSATPSASAAAGRSLTFASPCTMVEKSLGGEIFEVLLGHMQITSFYEPGDQLEGPVPTKDYGCLFSSGDAEFVISIGGTPLTVEAFEKQIPDKPGCSSVNVPADLGSTATVATSCPDGKYTSLSIEALYGDRAFTCGTRTLTKQVNDASTDYAVDLCIQIADQVTEES